MFQVRMLAVVGAAALCLGVVAAGLGGGSAGADSSGSLATSTTISAVPMTQPYGVPGQEFVVNVTSSAAPTGTVTVYSGTQQLCTNLALNPVGSTDTSSAICVDTDDTLAVTASVVALYSPDTGTFASSKGKASGVVVAASTSVSLNTSDHNGTWGAEQGIVFAGSVTNTQPGSTGTPTGTITVEQGATVICTMQLPSGSGTGTCAPDPTGMAPGTDDAVTAIYDGDTNFSASAASAPVPETIARAAATVTANGQVMVYGGGVPALTTTVSGLVAGQTLATSGISGQAACATTATGASAVGAYPITCSVGTLNSPDYAFTFAHGTLTVARAATTTSVNVSTSAVTVSVAPQFSGSPQGAVAVSLGGTSASCALAAQANGPSSCSVPVPTTLATGTYPVTASYGANGDFTGSSGTGQLVVVTSSTGPGSSPGGSSGGGTSGNTGGSGSSGSSGGTASTDSGGTDQVTGPYQTPQQLLAIAAAGVAVASQTAQQDEHLQALRQQATDEFLSALDKLKGGSSLANGSAGARSSSTHGQAGGPGIGSGSSNGGDSGGSGGGSTGKDLSANPTTVNLAVNQSKPASPVTTALLLGLVVLTLVAVAIVAMRRKAFRARGLVASAEGDEGAE